MPVQLVTLPESSALTKGNRMIFQFQGSGRVITTGTPAICILLFSGPIVNDTTVKLRWKGQTETILFKDAPLEPNEFTTGDGSSAYVDQLAQEFAAYYPFYEDFVVERYQTGIKLTARQPGKLYTVTLPTLPASITAGFGSIDGADPLSRTEYSIYGELWVQKPQTTGETRADFKRVATAMMRTDDQGLARWDVGDVLHSELTTDWPNWGLPIAKQAFNSAKKYFIAYGEAWGAPIRVSRVKDDVMRYAYLGGVDYAGRAAGSFQLSNFVKQATAGADQALRFGSKTRYVRLDEPQFLTFLNLRASVKASLEVSLKFSDSTTLALMDLIPPFDFGANEKWAMPVGIDQLSLLSKVPAGKKLVEYQVRLCQTTTTNYLSAAYRYILNGDYQPHTRYFAYVNSLGAIDTLATFGKGSTELTRFYEQAEKFLPAFYAVEEGQFIDYNLSLQKTIEVTTGFRSAAELDRWNDFYRSATRYQLTSLGGSSIQALPISITSKSIKQAKDDDTTFAHRFQYVYLFKDDFYTYAGDDELEGDTEPPLGFVPGGNVTITVPTVVNSFDATVPNVVRTLTPELIDKFVLAANRPNPETLGFLKQGAADALYYNKGAKIDYQKDLVGKPTTRDEAGLSDVPTKDEVAQTLAPTLAQVTKRGNYTPDAIKVEAVLVKTLEKKLTGRGVLVAQDVTEPASEGGRTFFQPFLQEWKPLAQVLSEEIDQPAIRNWFDKIADFANDADIITFFERAQGLGLLNTAGGGGGCFNKTQAELAYRYWLYRRKMVDPATSQPYPEPVFPDCSETPTNPTNPTGPTSTNPALTHIAHYALAAVEGAVYVGTIDAATCTEIRGWLFNKNNKAERCFVDIYLFGKKVATVQCYRVRDDVASLYGLPDNRVEFYYAIPDEYKQYATREIIVVVAGTQIPLSGSPVVVTSCAITAPTTQTGDPYVSGAASVQVGGPGALQSIKLRQTSGPDVDFIGSVVPSVTKNGQPGIGFEGTTLEFKAGSGTTSVGLVVTTQYVFTLNGSPRTLTKDMQVLVPGCSRPTSGLSTYRARWNFTPNLAGSKAILLDWNNVDKLVIEHYNNANPGQFSGDQVQIQTDLAVGREVFYLIGTDCTKLTDGVYFLQDAAGANTVNLIIEVEAGKIKRKKVPAFQAVNLVGQIERATCSEIVGHWFDANNTADKRAIIVQVDSTDVAEVIANGLRDDVAAAYGIAGANYCGIVYAIPAGSILKNGQPHNVGLRDKLTGQYLPGGPLQLTCNAPTPNRGPVLADPMPDVPIYAADEYTFALPDGQFTDPDGDPLTTEVLQTNGQVLPAWLTYLPTTRQFKKVAGFTDGSCAVLVRATDPKGLYATDDFLVTVKVPTLTVPRITRVDFEFVRAVQGASALNKLRIWTKVEGATNGVTTQFNAGPNTPDYVIGNQSAQADSNGYTHYREYVGANMDGILNFTLGPIDPSSGSVNVAGNAQFSYAVPGTSRSRIIVYPLD